MNIKKLVCILAVVMTTAGASFAQKFAFIDSDYILNQIPEYKAAQAELDKLSVQWQKEIESKYAEIDKLYKAFEADNILLTEELRNKRKTEIIGKEKEAKELQKQKFGVDGELFKKRQELVKPLQDKIYNAVKAIADKGGFAIIFDKASDMTMLYTNTKFDKSDEVLQQMGYATSGTGTNKK